MTKHNDDCDCIECVPRDLLTPFDEIKVSDRDYGCVVGLSFKRGNSRWLLRLDRSDAAKIAKLLSRYQK